MDSSNKEEGFADAFGGILEVFGTNVPQITVVVAVVLGSLTLDQYFHAGAWTIVAVLCFSLVGIFKRQIPRTLPRTGILAFFFVVILVSLPGGYYFAWLENANLGKQVEDHRKLVTSYAAFVSSIPIAMLIISYRRQEEVYGPPYPSSIEESLTQQIYKCSFYREQVVYEVKVKEMDNDWVTFSTCLSYMITNRDLKPHKYDIGYIFKHDSGEVFEAIINNEKIDHARKDYKYGRGVRIPKTIPPQTTQTVFFRVEEKFRLNDWDLYTTYIPASDLKVRVHNGFTNLHFDYEDLYFEFSERQDNADGSWEVHITKGLLPNQGLRLHWSG